MEELDLYQLDLDELEPGPVRPGSVRPMSVSSTGPGLTDPDTLEAFIVHRHSPTPTCLTEFSNYAELCTFE